MENYDLSLPQKAIYDMDRVLGGRATISGSVFFEYAKDTQKLYDAVEKLVTENEIFNTRIIVEDGIPKQNFQNQWMLNIETKQFENKDEYLAWAEKEAKKPMDINGVLYGFMIFKNNDNTSGVYFKLHHIISDAWGCAIIVNFLYSYYSNSPIKTNSYKNYLVKDKEYIGSERYKLDKEFWLSTCKDHDVNYINDTYCNNYDAKRYAGIVDSEKTAKLKKYCKKWNLSEYVFFLSIIAVYYSKIRDVQNFYIGSPILNRVFSEKNTIGTYINSVPIPICIDVHDRFINFAQHISEKMFSIIRRQKYPYSELMKTNEMPCKSALFDTIISFQNIKVNNIDSVWHNNGVQTESLQIHIDDKANKGSYFVNYDFLVGKFKESDIKKIHDHILNIIDSIIFDEEKKIIDISIMSDEEYRIVTKSFNSTCADFQNDKSVNEIFDYQVKANYQNVAVVDFSGEKTYQELSNRACSIMSTLIDAGIEKGDIVAVALPRGSDIVASFFGIVKSGGVYLPIDIELPKQRIEYQIKDSKAKFIILQDDSNTVLQFTNVDNIFLNKLSSKNSSRKVDVFANDACYCIYTSGSTGNPKGVLLSHIGIVNFCSDNKFNFANTVFSKGKTMLAVGSVAFDISIAEMIFPLLNGKKIIIASSSETKDMNRLAELIAENNVDIVLLTPSKLELFLNNKKVNKNLKNVNVFVLVGEEFNSGVYRKIKQNGNNIIINGYGPSETTMGASFCVVESSDNVSIGKPIANTQIYILDKYNNPMPVGAIGEICIAGVGVGKGYLNRPELTEEKFVKNPFGEGKMYKTGDLGKWREDGNIIYEGRIDNQLKIRGIRIELGEIENAIVKNAGLKQVVVAEKKDNDDRQYICAYYVGAAIDVREIKSKLSKILPQYMIPHFFIKMDMLPLTSSGKIDRKCLPLPNLNESQSLNVYEAPQTEKEIKIVNIWEKVFKISSIGINDDFFDLGGDSLKAIELSVAFESEGYSVSVEQIYNNTTPKELANALDLTQNTTFEIALPEDIKICEKENMSTMILLTGANGFLGAHLLKEIVIDSVNIVCCLVRDEEKFRKALDYYFGNEFYEKYNSQIEITIGDISKPQLGLNNQKYDCLKANVGQVINCAANVKHFGRKDEFELPNVKGVINLLTLCLECDAVMHHVSTMSVVQNYDSKESFYLKSKIYAEKCVEMAKRSGLRTNIYRVGNLSERKADGLFQINSDENGFALRIKALKNLGYISKSIAAQKIDVTYVDKCAEAICLLYKAGKYGETYNIFNDNIILVGEYLIKAGHNIQQVDDREFMTRLKNCNTSEADLLKVYLSHFKGDDYVDIDNKNTLQQLKDMGFEW